MMRARIFYSREQLANGNDRHVPQCEKLIAGNRKSGKIQILTMSLCPERDGLATFSIVNKFLWIKK